MKHRLTPLVVLVGMFAVAGVQAQGLIAARLGVIYNADDAASRRVAMYYAAQRGVPLQNVIAVHIPTVDVLVPEAFAPIRARMLELLPTTVQSLLLVWSKPFAVGCMSITTAFAAGYRAAFCEPGCERTLTSPLFDSKGWLPADTIAWYPAMLLPSDDEPLAHDLIERGIAADGTMPRGTLYLVRTSDTKRNVRAATYANVTVFLANRIQMEQLSAPPTEIARNVLGYFTGATHVEELPRIQFRPGALADHLTSSGGMLEGGGQMSALAWLKQGATASYGTVSEPCAILGKFPNVSVLFQYYLQGETALEAYWKSVEMPGQGLFIGEPLARPYAVHHL